MRFCLFLQRHMAAMCRSHHLAVMLHASCLSVCVCVRLRPALLVAFWSSSHSHLYEKLNPQSNRFKKKEKYWYVTVPFVL